MFWNPETTLVFKSKEEKVVIGSCKDNKVIPLTDEDVKNCEKYGLKYERKEDENKIDTLLLVCERCIENHNTTLLYENTILFNENIKLKQEKKELKQKHSLEIEEHLKNKKILEGKISRMIQHLMYELVVIMAVIMVSAKELYI